MSETRTESCDYCDMGWCEGRPEPTPDGPYFPSPLTEEDAIDRDTELNEAMFAELAA